MRILDIDLDFFLDNKHTTFSTSNGRLDEEEYKPWAFSEVKKFLIENCGLKEGQKVPGKFFETHDELYFHLKKLKDADSSLIFSVDHIDAHGDLGLGDSSYSYISSEILHMPVDYRSNPRLKKWDGLSEGNFLLFAIANQWIEELNYVGRKDWADDIPPFSFKDFDINSGFIQLKAFQKWQMDSMLSGNFLESAKSQSPVALEPEVKFSFVDFTDFRSNGDYDLITLTRSPQYTPKSSDELIPVITSFIELR